MTDNKTTGPENLGPENLGPESPDKDIPEADDVVAHLPAFLKAKKSQLPAEPSGQSWLRRFWPLLASFIVSAIWIGICIWWFMISDKTIARMPLYESGGLLAGASLPLILIWLVALVFLRTDPLRDHRMALAHGLDGLLAPLDVAQRRVNAIVSDLHKEIKHIEAASDIAATRIENLENRFQTQISSLFDVTTDAEAKAVHIHTTLSAEREAFNGLVAEITQHATEMQDIFKQLKFDSESIAVTSRKNSEKVSNEITFQNKTLDERSRQIEERLNVLGENLVNMSKEISENCDISGDKLSIISQSMSEKQADLTENMNLLANETRQICDKMDSQSKIITEIYQKTAEDSNKIAETLNDQAANLTKVATESLTRTTESGQEFQLQADAMEHKLAEATEKSKHLLDEASATFKDNSVEILQSSQVLTENLIKHMSRATEDLYAKSETLEHTISARVNAIEEALNKQAEIIRNNLTIQSNEISESLSQNSDKASDFISRQGTEIIDTMDQQFTGLMDRLEKQTTKLHEFANDTTTQLENTVASIEDQAKRVDDAVKLTTNSLNEKIVMMSDHYESFENLAEKFRNQVSQSEIQLKDQHDVLVNSISEVAEHLENALHKLRDESGSLSHHAQDIIRSIVEQTEQLSERIEDIRDRTENTIRNIQDMGETVSHQFMATDEQAAALSENWIKTASLVESQCSDTLSKLDGLSNKLLELEQMQSNTTETAETTVAKIADQMQLTSETIYLASASAMEAADETNQAIDQHAAKFQQLINALQLSNKSILIDAEAIEKRLKEKSGKTFSNLAAKIIEQLQSLSIDINRYIEEDVPDKVWQSYVDGDKSTFIRRLKKIANKKHIATIREKYKNDPEFRKYVLEYIQMFEDLMSQSMSSDSYSTFSVALISSETGKVYLALAQAADRFS